MGDLPSSKQACFVKGKEVRAAAIKAVREEAKAHFADRLAETDVKPVKALFEDMEQEIMRASIVGKGVRTDGRSPVADPPHHLRDRRAPAHPWRRRCSPAGRRRPWS